MNEYVLTLMKQHVIDELIRINTDEVTCIVIDELMRIVTDEVTDYD